MLALFLAVTIALPKEGSLLPSITRCYMNGATRPGETNIVVQGRNVPVHPQGGWVTMIDVHPGTNVLCVGDAVRTFTVAEPATGKVAVAFAPKPAPSALPYAAPYPKTNNLTRIIVLDPGHGGAATGTLSPHSIPEKDANLRLAKAVRKALGELGFTAILTREDDRDVPLYDRPRIAHEKQADAFVSIHHNSPGFSTDPVSVRYHTVYAWNGIGATLAKSINESMATALGDDLRSNGVMTNDFVVTRNSEIPSCLIEVDFITTPEGELASWDLARRKHLAAAIARGIAFWHKIWYNIPEQP